jgi:hypothetical protein
MVGTPPGDSILDVVKEALGHQWVFIQVDKMWRLGETEELPLLGRSRSSILATPPDLSPGARPLVLGLFFQGHSALPSLAEKIGNLKEKGP